METINQIHNIDAKDLCQTAIPDQSIDFIITDPVYSQIEDYLWLAQEAKRILKPDKSIIAFCSDIKMFSCKMAIEQYLTFVKPLYYVVQAKHFSALRGYNIMTWTTPALWFTNGKGWPHTRTLDTIITGGGPNTGYKWNKNLEAYTRWIEDFTYPGELIFDPFTGNGTVPYVCKQLSRDFIACEIDEKVYQEAQKRIKNVQIKAITLTGKQERMF